MLNLSESPEPCSTDPEELRDSVPRAGKGEAAAPPIGRVSPVFLRLRLRADRVIPLPADRPCLCYPRSRRRAGVCAPSGCSRPNPKGQRP